MIVLPGVDCFRITYSMCEKLKLRTEQNNFVHSNEVNFSIKNERRHENCDKFEIGNKNHLKRNFQKALLVTKLVNLMRNAGET